MITVNNFCAHWVKEVSITKYGSDEELPLTFSPCKVYQYSDKMLKHLPEDNLKSIQKTFLYSKKPAYFGSTSYDRRNFNSKDLVTTGLNAAQITEKKKQHAKDLNIDDRITLFQDQIADKYIYRIPLRYLSDIEKINFSTKIDYWIKLFLETDVNKLFESRKVLPSTTTTIPSANAEIIFTRAPFVQYEHILLDKNFRQHLEAIMGSKKNSTNGSAKNTDTKNV